MKALAAEMVRNFGQRLSALGITVQELTGDMQLSKSEIMKTQVQCSSMAECFYYIRIVIISSSLLLYSWLVISKYGRPTDV